MSFPAYCVIACLVCILPVPVWSDIAQSTVWPSEPICGFVASTSIATFFSQWSCNSSGSTNSDPCAWDGITCDPSNQISGIVADNSLTGTLTPLLGNIQTLTSISIINTEISGPLPSSWSSLTALNFLTLENNCLSGTLPSSWSSLASINFLFLTQNFLSGTLPSSWSSLRAIGTLGFENNLLTGSLPYSWNSFTSSFYLSFSGNSLTGTLPSSWSSLTTISFLFLSQNCLTGTLSSSWSSLIAINTLSIYQNSLSGSLPSSWSCFTSLNALYLSENSLTGALPSSWSSLTTISYLFLTQNSLTGTLSSSWSSLAVLNVLALDANFFRGSLPSSWSCLSAMRILGLYHNSLTGSLPSSWGSLEGIEYMFLDGNSLSGSVPALWGSMSQLSDLTLFQNYLTGPVSQGFDAMAALKYLYLSDNYFSGPLPTTWTSTALILVDMSNNMLSGSLPAVLSAYPVNLNALRISFNSLSGTMPPAVALFGNISYLNVSHNDIVGSIPNEFCSSQGVSIDIEGTGIECYSGCLTSTFVLVEGASADCHDGSIMGRFVMIAGSFVGAAVLFTVLYGWYGWWPPAFASVCTGISCGIWSTIEYGIVWLSTVCGKIDTGSEEKGCSGRKVSISLLVFGMVVAKFLVGLVVSLTLNNWWTYSGGHDVARNNEVLASCSNPTVGNCYSYCGDVHVVTVNVTTDDVVFDDVLDIPIAKRVASVQSNSYCIATLPGYCGYEVWMDLKLLPILVYLLCLVLQIILWRFGSDKNLFYSTPQKNQYDLILKQMYPQISKLLTVEMQQEDEKGRLTCDFTFAARLSLLRQLTTPLFPSIFWFLELVTVVYVWGELWFPPVYCGSVPPLSLYYYPIVMSLLDLMKLNIYTSVELWRMKHRLESILMLLNLQLFITHMWVTVAIGLMFVVGVLQACFLGLQCCLYVMLGRCREKLNFSAEQKSESIEMTASADSSVNAIASNPMLLGTDVEWAGVDPALAYESSLPALESSN